MPASWSLLPPLLLLFILGCATAASSTRIFHHEADPLPPTRGPQSTGFVDINSSTKAEMFYWLFEASPQLVAASQAPVPLILWLEGGPGISGMFQVFYGMGPYRIDLVGNVSLNQHSWDSKYHLLFVDNPCGVGYSTVNSGGEVVNMEEMAEELYLGLMGFYQDHPELASSPLYVFGESYGGKYGPAIVEYIHRMNQVVSQAPRKDRVVVNLKGLGVGNGLVDTPTQVTAFADFYLAAGFFTEAETQEILAMQQAFAEYYEAGKEFEATVTFWDIVYAGSLQGGFNMYDYTCDIHCMEARYDWTAYEKFLNRDDVRAQLGTTNKTFVSVSGQVSGALYPDVCRSEASKFSVILSNYKVILYQGLYDIVVTSLGSEIWLNKVEWSGMEEFKKVERKWWMDPNANRKMWLAGLARSYSNLTQVTFYSAGHFVNMDQPLRSLDMVTRFVEDLSFDPNFPIPTPPSREGEL